MKRSFSTLFVALAIVSSAVAQQPARPQLAPNVKTRHPKTYQTQPAKLPADAVNLNASQLEGTPANTARDGYYLFHNAKGWHVLCRESYAKGRTFYGSASLKGKKTAVLQGIVRQDPKFGQLDLKVSKTQRVVSYRFKKLCGLDGLTFTTTGGTYIVFRLKLAVKPAADHVIYLGAGKTATPLGGGVFAVNLAK